MRVAIIGGGISGITAALYLQRLKNVSCIDMMVMNRRLGGRIYSVERKGYWVDVGANLLDF
jgi:protoporphyrinogen oxidase